MPKLKKKQIEYKGHIFDSSLEVNYFRYLENEKINLGIEDIICHPAYEIIPAAIKACPRCYNAGKVKSPKTGKDVKCTLCDGTGYKEISPSIFTPDFELLYIDGRREIIDVKGDFYKKSQIDKTFPIRKKLFEARYGLHVYVVTWDNVKGWEKK
jgi:hypothetical protein